jgi:AcrR family transcriptional regulator
MKTSAETDVSKNIIDAAMVLAAKRGWRAVTMTDIAVEADIALLQLHKLYRTKAEILTGLSRQADAAVLADPVIANGEESARDRLFDVIMRRFDALASYKQGIAALLREPPDPHSALTLTHQLTNSMRWMLEAADINTSGLRGSIQATGLAVIYANVMRTWLRDDSLDAARTMSELDRELRWAEQIINSFGRPKSGGRRTHSDTPAPEGSLDPSI